MDFSNTLPKVVAAFDLEYRIDELRKRYGKIKSK
jgi:hypothetical protein